MDVEWIIIDLEASASVDNGIVANPDEELGGNWRNSIYELKGKQERYVLCISESRCGTFIVSIRVSDYSWHSSYDLAQFCPKKQCRTLVSPPLY